MKERESYSRTKDLKWQKVHFLHIVLRLDSLLLLFDFNPISPGLFLSFWAWRGGGGTKSPLEISKSIDALVMKLGTYLVRH